MCFTMLLAYVHCSTGRSCEQKCAIQALMSGFAAVLSLNMSKGATSTRKFCETDATHWFAGSGTGLDQLFQLVIGDVWYTG